MNWAQARYLQEKRLLKIFKTSILWFTNQRMSKILLLVGCGGFLGSMSRYLCQQVAIKHLPLAFPYGTFLVNILGSFLIGIIYGLSERGGWLTPEWRFFLATGFCGGFTTFSTFSFESLTLMREGNYLNLGLYVALSVILGLAAAFLGLNISK